MLRAALNLAGTFAIIAYFSHLLIARTFLALVIPIGAVLQLDPPLCPAAPVSTPVATAASG